MKALDEVGFVCVPGHSRSVKCILKQKASNDGG